MARSSDLDVAYVVKLARINLTEAEAKVFQKQLDDVLNYVEKLRQADVSHVEAAAHTLPIFNVFRGDAPSDCFTAVQRPRIAPRQPTGLCVVPEVAERPRSIA